MNFSMPRYLSTTLLEELSKAVWRIDLVWIDIPSDDTLSAVYLTDHFHDIVVPPQDLEPNITKTEDYTFIATSGLMSVGVITDDLEAKDAPLTIALDGIRREFIATVLSTKIKGSAISLYRGFYDQETGRLIGKPIKRWVGRVDGISVSDSSNIELEQQEGSLITLDCRNIVSLIRDKQSGIYTSESSWNRHYPLDTSMHNVAGLVDRQFNFGKEE
jgi:hypothetical protein